MYKPLRNAYVSLIINHLLAHMTFSGYEGQRYEKTIIN